MNALLAPSNHTIFPDDINIESESVRAAIKGSAKRHDNGSFFYPPNFINFETGKFFKSADEFIGSNTFKRGGSPSRYSNKFFLDIEPEYKKVIAKKPKFPWNNDSMIIITNGMCGSSCALIAQYLQEVGNVKTIAVGGFAKKDMSFASFTGGANVNYEFIYEDPNLKSVPKKIEYNVDFGFTFLEAYSLKYPDQVMDFQFRPADKRIYYDENSARDPSLLWVQASKIMDTFN